MAAWLVGFLPPPLNYTPAIEFFAPWAPAILCACLVAWLLVRPGRIPALLLGLSEILHAYGSLQHLVIAAWVGARLEGQQLAGHYSAVSTWYTESLHAALHVTAATLLVVGFRRFRRAQEEARRVAVLDAF